MRWILVERKPDVIYAGKQAIYLGLNAAETPNIDLALSFATREEAEAHRRRLKHPYDWVAMSRPK